MSKLWKKTLALTLALCTVLSLAVPAAAAESEPPVTEEEEYVFPEYGEEYLLGTALQGELSTREFAAVVQKEGKDYLLIPSKGGTLYAFKLSDYLAGNTNNGGTWIEASVSVGYAAHGMVVDSKGVVYLSGPGDVFAYDLATNTSWKIPTPGDGIAGGITIDENDNLYVARQGNIIKIETNNANYTTVINKPEDMVYASTIVYGGGNIYIMGQRASTAVGSYIRKLDLQGNLVSECTLEKNNGTYYMSWVDGVLFVGHSASMAEGVVAVDTATMERIDIGVNTGYIMGVVTDPTPEGKCYMQVSGVGVWEYDVATRKATMVPGMASWQTNLRIRNPYMDVNYEGITGKAILTVASGGATPSLLSLEGKGFVSMEALVEEGVSAATTRTLVSGVPGLKVNDPDDEEGTPAAEVAVYVGGYLSPRVARYSPDLEAADRLESNVFSNGHAQTDAMIVYNDKIYGGTYSGAYLWEYDPATGVFTELIHGMNGQEGGFNYDQARIHSLSAGDNKIFFSTVPYTNILGGCIGWYDLTTGETYIERNVVFEQILISIYYDEETDLLYGASSVAGGSKAKATQKEAKMLVYDVAAKQKLGDFSVRSSENPNSDMVFDLESGDLVPEYIAGISRDPDTGKFWGLVSRTLFTFEYDRASNALKIHEEWGLYTNNADKSQYPHSASLQWFPRPFVFDGKGNLYITLDTGAYLCKFNLETMEYKTINKTVSSRIMAMGTDGNLYLGNGQNLYMIPLQRPSIVQGMIESTEPKDIEGVKEARRAYNALTDDERAELGEEYANGLLALEGAAKIFQEVAAQKAADAIDEIGAVTVTSMGNILAARNAYNALDEEVKALVSNYDALVAAENAYATISGKTTYNASRKTLLSFKPGDHPRAATVSFAGITYEHVTGGLWEYASGSAKFNAGKYIQINFGSQGTGHLGLRVKVSEEGLYDLTVNSMAYGSGGIGAVFMIPTDGLSQDEVTTLVKAEVTQSKAYTDHYIGSVDFTVEASQAVGQWYCEKAGEYILAFGRLETKGGDYARVESVELSKTNPVTDPTVELAKERINAIGKVTKKSGAAITEARYTYDALTAEQKELIYAPQLEAAEKAYADISAQAAIDEAAAAVVKIQIESIGTVTVGSESAIKAAREAYDALTKDQKKLVPNVDVLEKAEKDFAALTAGSGDEPVEDDNGMLTTIIIIAAAVLVVAVVVVVIIVAGKKKKAAPAEKAEEVPSAEEILDK